MQMLMTQEIPSIEAKLKERLREALAAPLTLDTFLHQLENIEDAPTELYIATPETQFTMSGPTNLKPVTKIDYDVRSQNCDRCNATGKVERDAGGYTSHSLNQVFEEVDCPVCEGRGKQRIVLVVFQTER